MNSTEGDKAMKEKNRKKIALIFAAGLLLVGIVWIVGLNVWKNYNSIWKRMDTCTVDGVTYNYSYTCRPKGKRAFIERPYFGIWVPGSVAPKRIIGFGAAIDSSTSGALKIPAAVDGYSVKAIDREAFAGCARLESVTIPDGVEAVWQDAFKGCTGLESVTFLSGPNGKERLLIMVGSVFAGCTNLATITFPENITRFWLGDLLNSTEDMKAALEAEGSSAELLIPCARVFRDTPFWRDQAEGVVIKSGWVLGVKGNCPEHVVLPEGTRGIVKGAFMASLPGCDGVYLSGSTNLVSIVISEGVTEIPRMTFVGCKRLSSVTLPLSVKEIGSEAFAGCESLTSMTIPSSVEKMWSNAFEGCTGLKAIVFEGAPPEIRARANEDEFFGGAIGYYRPEHEGKWKKVIGADGKWYGMKMESAPRQI